MEFVVGSQVRARGLAWDVTGVAQLGAQQLLRLRCAAGDLRGLEWDILHPAETVEIIRADLRPEAPGDLAAWRLWHEAHLLEQVPGAAEFLAAEPGRVQIEPYQLVPLMRALELPRVRLLLADGVGLGKTIEAALIVTELIARRRAHRVLVITPAGPLLMQWEQELRLRFGLRFVAITDQPGLQRERRKLELGGNPFDVISLCLTSLDFAKQERVLEELERSSWDLAIIDEAHHCIGSTISSQRDDTLRRQLAEVVSQRSDGLLLLTATPHDGFDPHFASLIELLDPSLVDGRGGLAGTAYRRHVVRRLKSHIRDPTTGAPLFRERRVVPVPVEVSGAAMEPVRAFHQALGALVAPRLKRAAPGHQYQDALAFISLLKRSVSTIAACVNTLRVVVDRYRHLGANEAEAAALRKERARTLRAYRRRALQFGALDADTENDAARLEADAIAADLLDFGAKELASELSSLACAQQRKTTSTIEAMDALIRLGGEAEIHDPKLNALLHEVAQIRATESTSNILIYTEYADSQLAALQALRKAPGIRGEVLAISGLDAERERTHAAERCAQEDGIILISTDSLAEGLNLQQRCCNLIHLDLPYNPNRLEQRNGRIDRYGQTRDPQIRYLYLAGTFEERLLLRLIAKYEKARAHLAFMPDTLGVTADPSNLRTGLIAGFAERQASLFEDEAPAIRTLDHVGEEMNAEAYRDLLHEIDRAFEGYERTAVRHGWLADQGLNADAAQVAAADTARRRSNASLVNLAGFVTRSIELETGVAPAEKRLLRLPGDWIVGLDGLPGFDRDHQTLRITRDRSRLSDSRGRPLGFLGRAHPLVRRAISRSRRAGGDGNDGPDYRVSAARTEDGTQKSLVLTFGTELHSARQLELQRVIAVLLPEFGSPTELHESARWLRYATPEHTMPTNDVWRRKFAGWAPKRLAQARAVALTAMQQMTASFLSERRNHMEREGEEHERWFRLRADDICGAFVPPIDDLFGDMPTGPEWRIRSMPLDRLAAFATDTGNPSARRREANSVIELFNRYNKDRKERTHCSRPTLHPIGMLMLVPADIVG